MIFPCFLSYLSTHSSLAIAIVEKSAWMCVIWINTNYIEKHTEIWPYQGLLIGRRAVTTGRLVKPWTLHIHGPWFCDLLPLNGHYPRVCLWDCWNLTPIWHLPHMRLASNKAEKKDDKFTTIYYSPSLFRFHAAELPFLYFLVNWDTCTF